MIYVVCISFSVRSSLTTLSLIADTPSLREKEIAFQQNIPYGCLCLTFQMGFHKLINKVLTFVRWKGQNGGRWTGGTRKRRWKVVGIKPGGLDGGLPNLLLTPQLLLLENFVIFHVKFGLFAVYFLGCLFIFANAFTANEN